MAERRDWSWLEVPLLFGVLVAGAFARYWLSTAVPFDAGELEALWRANVRTHAVRIPFMMFSGLGLFALYILVRRSAGVPAAFALIFLLQTSVAFQEQALRMRWSTVVAFVVIAVLTYLRFSWPAWRPPRRVSLALVVLAVLLAGRGVWLLVTLSDRLDSIRGAVVADSASLHASLVACGGGVLTPAERLADCTIAWPSGRSLAQQEALLGHEQILSRHARLLDGPDFVLDDVATRVAVYDAKGAALFVVAEGEMVATARRVLGIAD